MNTAFFPTLRGPKRGKTLPLYILMMEQNSKPDIITVNGERFRIIKKASERAQAALAERPAEVSIGLIRADGSGSTPTHKITYQYERPNEMEFFRYDHHTKEWRLERMLSISL